MNTLFDKHSARRGSTMRALGWAACILIPVLVITLMRGAARDFTQPNRIWPVQMADDQAYGAFTRHPVLAGGMTMQPPPEHTIPRGFQPFHYDTTAVSLARAGRELHNPFEPNEQTLARGKAVYETFCQVCHGATGAGDGPLIPKYPNPPAFRTQQAMDRQDGELFHIITLGRNNMPANAPQVAADDRWQVVLYIRQLQNQ